MIRRLLAAMLLAAGCVSYPVALLPDPPAETTGWDVPGDGMAFLGLHTEENDSRSLDALFFEPGVRVRHVVENSPAQQAGFRQGDVVLKFGQHEVNDPGALDNLLRHASAGDEVELTVGRGDTVFAVSVRLTGTGPGAAPEPRQLYRADPARSRAGWAPVAGGVRLVTAAEDSPFPAAGIPVGSRITAADGVEVLSPRALFRILHAHEPGDTLPVTVDGTRDVFVRMPEQPSRLTGLHIPILFYYDTDPDGSSTTVSVLDFWAFAIFRYTREEAESTWEFLEWFEVSSGVGELAE